MLHIEALEIEDGILDKVESKHGISFQELEEACFFEAIHVRRSREGLYKLFSRTNAGRYILVVLVNIGHGIWKVVTAREMTDNERRLFKKTTGDG